MSHHRTLDFPVVFNVNYPNTYFPAFLPCPFTTFNLRCCFFLGGGGGKAKVFIYTVSSSEKELEKTYYTCWWLLVELFEVEQMRLLRIQSRFWYNEAAGALKDKSSDVLLTATELTALIFAQRDNSRSGKSETLLWGSLSALQVSMSLQKVIYITL